MSQVRSDAATPQAQAGPRGALRPRPRAPHLQVWRPHLTMAASISTRATGIVLYVGALIVAALLAALATGADAYATALGLLHSPLGLLVLFGVTVSLFYHLAAGLRHLFWDMGAGFQPRTATLSAAFAFGFGLLASVALWAVLLATGAV